MNINFRPIKCSGQSRYGRYGSYATVILGFRQQAVTSQKLSLPENDSALHVFNLNTDCFYVYAPTSRPAAAGAPSQVTGADPDIEEGRGIHRMSLVRPCGARSQRSFLHAHITQSVVGGSGGMLPQENF